MKNENEGSMELLSRKEKEGNWVELKILFLEKEYRVLMKQFERGSKFGIDGGRISKMVVYEGKKELLSYDRGWDKKPEGKDAKAFLEIFLDLEN